MIKQIDDKWYKVSLVLVFSFVFIYLLVRTIFTDTLHDEVASYIFYFYQGDYIGDSMHWDANNHLLNSFLGHQLFKVFGDNFAMLRLPNLLSFILYFWGSYQLTKNLKTPWLKLLGIIAMISIPFIIEFFSAARGYGLSMGLFVCALVFFQRYISSFKINHLFLFYASIVLSVAANLTIINSGLILIGIQLIALFLYARENQFSMKYWMLHISSHVCGILLLLPFIWYGILLKDHGALYYGSLDGLWEVTIKSLSQYVFFTDSKWILAVYLFVGLCSLYALYISTSLKDKMLAILRRPLSFLIILILGNLFAILLLANLFAINYPEDRTAMYFIPLSILLALHSFDQLQWGRYLQFSLLFFPIVFIKSLSIETSVFYPDDRMNRGFYESVKAQLNPENTIMIYPIMNWNWPYLESKHEKQSSVALFSAYNSTLSDFILTKTSEFKNPDIYKLYDTIAYHPASTHIAFKRKEFLTRTLFTKGAFENGSSNNEFIRLGELHLDSLADKHLILTLKGHLKTVDVKDKLSLVVSVKDKNEQDTRYLYYSFETVFQSKKIDYDFHHNFLLDHLTSDESEIKVYLWNRGLNLCTLSNSTYELYELKEP